MSEHEQRNDGQPADDRGFQREEQKRRRRLVAKLAGLMLLLGAGAIGFESLWYNHIVRQRIPVRAKLAFASIRETPIRYRVDLLWKSPGTVHPQVLLDGKPVPQILVLEPTRGEVRRINIGISIPPDCDIGFVTAMLHEGQLIISPAEGEAAATQREVIGIRANVLPPFHPYVRWVTYATLGALSLLYSGCYVVFYFRTDRPRGELSIRVSNEPEGFRSPVQLKTTWNGRLLPWERGIVKLEWILDKAGSAPNIDGIRGFLDFTIGAPPYLELQNAGPDVKVLLGRRYRSQIPLPSNGKRFDFAEALYEDTSIVFWDPDCRIATILTYTQSDRP